MATKSLFYNLTVPNKEKRKKINSFIKVRGQGNSACWAKVKANGPLFLPIIGLNLSKQEFDRELAVIDFNNEEQVLIGEKDNKVIVNFDFFATEDFLLQEKYLPEKKAPLFSMLPYKSFPLVFRNLYFSYLKTKEFFLKKKFPSWPIEPSLDALRQLIWSNAAKLASTDLNLLPYPDEKKFTVILTHDIEEKEGFKQIPLIREIEKKYSLKSSWLVLSKKYNAEDSLLTTLIEKNNEIMSHGFLHNGKLPFLSEEEIAFRLMNLFQSKPWLKPHVKGFRSGQLLRSKKLSMQLKNFFAYDLSFPDTERLSPMGPRSGCCTIFPFLNNNLLSLPLTMPQDYYLLHVYGYKPNKVLQLWKEKINYLEKYNGIAVFNVHPDKYISGNAKMLRVYDKLLHFLSKKNPFFSLPRELFDFTKKIS